MMLHDFPLSPDVYQHFQCWLNSRGFETLCRDLRMFVRAYPGHAPGPTVGIMDNHTIQSAPQSGARAGCDGATKSKGSY
jgi:hypothetical protein